MSLAGEKAEAMTVEALIDERRDLKKMTTKQLHEELATYRILFDYLPDEVRSFLVQVDMECMVVTRNYQHKQGTYLGMSIEITEHRFMVYERIRNNIEKKYEIHKSEAIIPKSNIVELKFIKNTYQDTPDPTY